MSTGHLTIDLSAIADNWRALDAKTNVETAAVVKANGYGMGAGRVARTLADAGARRFFVAVAEEGAAVREAVGPGPMIAVLSGHMDGDTDLIRDNSLTPMLNSVDQVLRHVESLPRQSFGIQLDTGMNRLGLEPEEWAALRDVALKQKPALLMSHLACADEPDHFMNQRQLTAFREMTDGLDVPRSLAATGGLLLGADYHFDVTRPGIGLYGGRPYEDAKTVVRLDLPVAQIRDVAPGESVGYGNTWTAQRPSRIATLAAGYADGLFRALSPGIKLFDGADAYPIAGRISMDLITVDITEMDPDRKPEIMTLMNNLQGVDALADVAGTIGYELLTQLSQRYKRSYIG
ncbi:alanine racemase [Pseudodonghicola xiamenensis]|uniref:Alanine racemase n=1 Tax=Pseudodonghicola xiamenensis TaxID=337702 RepID=A0A8J3MAH1_9RHOB|nr:alanine racemase [Pseudodonghicola xiamenensis]GHG79486.1 alanine racemase [Pseudodonghicola xiamenensis]